MRKDLAKGKTMFRLWSFDNNRVLEVDPGLTKYSVDNLWETLNETFRQGTEAVAMDMSQPLMESTLKACPTAEIVNDKFHVSKYLGEAVAKVRRQENKQLL